MHQTLDKTSGHYRVERLLGQGGMADVYRAVNEASGHKVALKLVRSSDPSMARRLAAEAKALSALDHPGLVRLLDSGVQDDQAYLVMDLVEGPTLARQLQNGPLSTTQTAEVGRALSEALSYVHDRGIVHRDVKPGNVLLGPGKRVRLADFGIAQLVDHPAMTVTASTLGTVAYMAPEQLDDHRVGSGADVWSLGLILLESLLGQRVYEGTPSEIIAKRLSAPTPVPDGLPVPWRVLIESMLQRDPDSRPKASEVAGLVSAPLFRSKWAPSRIPSTSTSPATEPQGNLAQQGRLQGEAPTRAGTHTPTLLGPPPLRPEQAPRHASRRRRTIALAILATLLLGGSLAGWSLASNASLHLPPPKVATTTTTAAVTATTGPPSAGAAAAALTRDIQSAESAGTLDPTLGQEMLYELGRALSAAAKGNAHQVSKALGEMDGIVASGVQSGQITQATAATLVSDVSDLSSALGAAPAGSSGPGAGSGNSGGDSDNSGSGNSGSGNSGSGRSAPASPPITIPVPGGPGQGGRGPGGHGPNGD